MSSLLISVLLFGSTVGESLFNLDELESSQYSVSILDTPISLDQQNGNAIAENIVIMMNKFGQKYQCLLPNQENGNEDGSGSGGEDGGPAPDVDIGALITPLHSTPCLVRTKDWWTYQICFGKEISQYHVENDKAVGEILSLGTFNTDIQTEDKHVTYYPEWYTNGSKCDLTGRGRETELRFVCNEKAPREFIGDIFEPKSCEYTIVIHTDKICSVPQFKPPVESEPLDINCKPILVQEQMQKYEQYSKLKARKLELKRIKVKQEQQKFLSLMSSNDNPLKAIPGFGDESIKQLVKELGDFLDTSDPEMKVINMKGESPTMIPNKEILNKDDSNSRKMTRKESLKEAAKRLANEDGEWQKIHDPNSIQNLKAKLEDLETRLAPKEEFVSYNLNTALLSIYQDIEKAELQEDVTRLVVLRKEKEQIETQLKESQEDIRKMKEAIIDTKSKLFQAELQQVDNKGVLKKEDASYVKKKVKDELPNIMKDAMKELGMQDEEFEGMDETMSAMELELNQLMEKLQGASGKESGGLKRDGKRSVKKELRENEDGLSYDEPSDDDTTKTLEHAVERLKEMNSELDSVEEDLKDKKSRLMKDIEKAKKNGGVVPPDDKSDLSDEKVSKMYSQLQHNLKSKIENLGLDKLSLDTPIQVKVIATNVPDEDIEGMDQNYYDGILHNIMIGNDKGYKDIQNQVSADKNYKFNIDESEMIKLAQDVGKLEAKVIIGGGDFDELTEDADEYQNDADLYDVLENNDDLASNIDDEEFEDFLMSVPEARRRPSSMVNNDELEDVFEESDYNNADMFNVDDEEENDNENENDLVEDFLSQHHNEL